MNHSDETAHLILTKSILLTKNVEDLYRWKFNYSLAESSHRSFINNNELKFIKIILFHYIKLPTVRCKSLPLILSR